jgi:hypothetical protein
MMMGQEIREIGGSLVAWLNAGSDSKRVYVARLANIMLIAQRLEPAEKQVPLLYEITQRLSKYKLTVQADLIDAEKKWIINKVPDRLSRPEVSVEEWRAAGRLLSLAEAGHLARLKRCKFCDRWVFAVREDQAFCGRERRCRQKWFGQKSEREKRNEQRRQNHQPKKASQRTGGSRGKRL